MFVRIKKLTPKVIVTELCFDVFTVTNAHKWERHIHGHLKNYLIAGEVFQLNRQSAIQEVKNCLRCQLEVNPIVPLRSRMVDLRVNGSPQLSLPVCPHIIVFSVESIPRVLLCRAECPRTWFERFVGGSLHTHCTVDAFNERLLAINTVQDLLEELGAIRLTSNGTINKDRETVVTLISRHLINHVNET